MDRPERNASRCSARQRRQSSGVGARPDKGKGGKGKAKKGGKGKEKDEKQAGKFEGECRYCQKKGHKKAVCRKMQADLAAGKCDKSGKPTVVNSLTGTGATQPSPQASNAPSAVACVASTIPMQQIVPVYFPSPVGSQAPHQTETWLIKMIGPAKRTLIVASLDGAEYALLDSESDFLSNQCR